MTALVMRNSEMVRGSVDVDASESRATNARRNDAHMGVKVLDILRADVDLVGNENPSAIGQPLVEMYRGTITSGDELRLPLMTNHDGPSLRAALARVTMTDTSRVTAGSKDDVLKEARMIRTLQAL